MSISIKNLKSGIIIKAVSGFYYVSSNNTLYQCKARGNFRHSKVSPIVGDRVNFSSTDENEGVIENILPRKNALSRPTIANIDKVVIVSSAKNPSPDTYLIDKMTAIAEFNNIEPVIVFNKSDIGDFGNLFGIYKNAGFRTYVVSAVNKETLSKLKFEFNNCVCAMAGNSGVGKSSLLNALFEELNLKTGEISTALGRGRHTTRHTELFETKLGGYIADTPGFSSVIKVDNPYEFKQNLICCFKDISSYVDCKYSTCTHTCEAGCGVLNALNNGRIEKTRHESYVTLFNELKNINSWSNKG